MDTENNIFKNGSVWLRADFHLHTKADKEFNYVGEENDFSKLYTEQLNNQNIGIGVITNHNKFDKSEFIALKKKAKLHGIGLFPGLESSLKEGIHILIVFDDIWYIGNNDNINDFIKNAFYGIKNYDLPPYPNSKFDLENAVKALNDIGYDYFIILAHIDDNNGLFKVLTGRTLDAFIQDEAFEKVLAVQKSGNKENYKRLCEKCKREIACVEGSDNAEGGIKAIGSGRKTYLKIGDFNFEALTFALMDKDNRLSSIKAPEIENIYIKSISFEGGLLDGKTLNFSPELNNIIGIRGSGKSSILEILRYSLNIQLGKQAVDPNYKNDLIEYALKSGGKIIVTVVNEHKEEYVIEKILGQKEDIFKDGIRQDISLDGVIKKRPVYFGQKDLSNKDIDFEADLIHKLIGNKLENVKSKIASKNIEIESIVTEIKKLRNLNEIKKDTETNIKDAKHQLEKYKEHDIETKLKQQSLFDNDISKLSDIQNTIIKYISDLQNIIDDYTYFYNQELSGSDVNKELFEEAKQVFSDLNNEFKKLQQILINSKTIYSKFHNIIEKISDKKEGLKEEFARIKREINVPSLNPDDFLKLNRLIETSNLKLREIEKSEKKRAELKKTLNDKLYELNELWREEYEILKNEIDRINMAENKLGIEVKFKERRDKFLNELKEVFRGTNIRVTAYEEITGKYKDFIEIFKSLKPLEQILNENQLVDFKRRFIEHQSELLTYQVENQFIIKYNEKPLKALSLGQRASALILFLLAQKESDILIIDQPEDDLDNQTIYEEVIKEIKGLKGNMQFIFATHNANIPVLGDSEKVIACTYVENKKIELYAGTIDNREIQHQIINIMEGGREAFRMRKNIYSIWKIEK